MFMERKNPRSMSFYGLETERMNAKKLLVEIKKQIDESLQNKHYEKDKEEENYSSLSVINKKPRCTVYVPSLIPQMTKLKEIDLKFLKTRDETISNKIPIPIKSKSRKTKIKIELQKLNNNKTEKSCFFEINKSDSVLRYNDHIRKTNNEEKTDKYKMQNNYKSDSIEKEKDLLNFLKKEKGKQIRLNKLIKI